MHIDIQENICLGCLEAQPCGAAIISRVGERGSCLFLCQKDLVRPLTRIGWVPEAPQVALHSVAGLVALFRNFGCFYVSFADIPGEEGGQMMSPSFPGVAGSGPSFAKWMWAV